MSLAQKGKPKTVEHIKRASEAHKGGKWTDEARAKFSASKKGCIGSRKGQVVSEKTREKMSQSAKLRALSKPKKSKPDGGQPEA